jgi:hypothetical protein
MVSLPAIRAGSLCAYKLPPQMAQQKPARYAEAAAEAG